MSEHADTESKFVNVDLEQWRRDIDTFAAATTSALDAIIGELSTVCSGGQVRSLPRNSERQLPVKRKTVLQQGASDVRPVRTAATNSSTDRGTTPASGSRLASLKEKLASRINKV